MHTNVVIAQEMGVYISKVGKFFTFLDPYCAPPLVRMKSVVEVCHVFTARCYASAVLAMSLCLSVSVSVKVGVLLKRLNIGSHKEHHTIAQGL